MKFDYFKRVKDSMPQNSKMWTFLRVYVIWRLMGGQNIDFGMFVKFFEDGIFLRPQMVTSTAQIGLPCHFRSVLRKLEKKLPLKSGYDTWGCSLFRQTRNDCISLGIMQDLRRIFALESYVRVRARSHRVSRAMCSKLHVASCWSQHCSSRFERPKLIAFSIR